MRPERRLAGATKIIVDSVLRKEAFPLVLTAPEAVVAHAAVSDLLDSCKVERD